jgi:hypothetical protein
MSSILFHKLPAELEKRIIEMKTTLEVSEKMKDCFTSILSKSILQKYNDIKTDFDKKFDERVGIVYFDIFLQDNYLEEIISDFNHMKNCNCCSLHSDKPQDIFVYSEEFRPHILFKKFIKRETKCMCFCKVLTCKFINIFHSTPESFESDTRLLLDARIKQLNQKIEKDQIIKWEKTTKKSTLEYTLNSFGNYENNELEEEMSEKIHQLYLDIDRLNRNIQTNISLKNDLIREIVNHIERFDAINTIIDSKYR